MNPTIPNANTCYPSWTSTGCTGPTALDTIGGSSPTLGEPNAANGRHTYDSFVYDPDDDVVLQFGGGTSGSATPLFSIAIWSLSLSGLDSNPNAANWTRKDTSGATFVGAFKPSDLQTGGCASPPIALYTGSHKFLLQCSAGYVWTYNIQTNTVTWSGNFGGSNVRSGSTAVLYPPSTTVYYFGGDDKEGNQSTTTTAAGVWSMSYAGSSWATTNITGSTTGCSVPASATHPGVTYDPDNGLIYLYPNFGNVIYSFNPSTLTCAPITPTGDSQRTNCGAGTNANTCPPDQQLGTFSPNGTTGTYGRFQYVGSGTLVLVNYAGNNGYTYSLPGCFISTSGLPSINTGQQYNQTINTSGCAGPTFSVSVGSIPSGMTLNTSSGTITGFAWTSGTSAFTIAVTDSNGNASEPLSIAVNNPSLPSTTNTVTVTNSSGSPITNYPVQIGRAFADHEICSSQVPQAWVGSTAIPTQVDIKNRWSVSGCIKFAVLSFVVPSISATSSVTVTLGPGSSVGNLPLGYPSNTAAATAILASSAYNFDAQIQLTGSAHSPTTSARTMLSGGDYTVWTSGPIATMYVLANHSMGFTCVSGVAVLGGTLASKYDVGTADGNCPFRGEFEATFWVMNGSEEVSGGTHVNVRYIGEVANTENLEDVTVSNVVLTLGNTSPTTIYNYASSSGKSSLTMGVLTRWTYSGGSGSYGVGNWIGGTPSNQVGINHNLTYLSSTKILPNYDTSFSIPGATITSAFNTWTNSLVCDPAKCISAGTKDLYNQADFTISQGDTGGRSYPANEIGPFTSTEVLWMYTGDYRPQQMAIRYAELAGAWPVHWREGKGGKTVCRAGTSCSAVSGVGHYMSVSSRPSYCWGCGNSFFNASAISANDAVTPLVAPALCPGNQFTTQCGWLPDVGHVPDWTPVYLFTGDYYFLEELWAWNSATALQYPGQQNGGDYSSRGPTGAEGHIPGSAVIFNGPRATGWGLRSREEIAVLSPDGTPEQLYYDELTRDLLASMEGERGVILDIANQPGCTEGGISCVQFMWNWGNQFASASFCTSNPSKNGLWCNNGYNHSLGVPTSIPWWVPDAYNSGNCNYPISNAASANSGCTEPWMVDFVIYALGRAGDLGYGGGNLLAWVAPMRISQVVEPSGAPNPGQVWTLADGFNPYLVSATGEVDIQPASGGWTTTLPQVLASTCSSVATGCNSGVGGTNAQTALTFRQPMNQFDCGTSNQGTGNCGGALEAGLGLSQLSTQPGGATAWNWIYANAMSPSLGYNTGDPKWDIIPRPQPGTPGTMPSTVYGGAVH